MRLLLKILWIGVASTTLGHCYVDRVHSLQVYFNSIQNWWATTGLSPVNNTTFHSGTYPPSVISAGSSPCLIFPPHAHKIDLNVAHVLRLSRPHNAMCGWPLCIQTNLLHLLFTILNWFSDCCICSALPPTHVFMVAHRIVIQQFYFQCLRISSVILICFVYTPIKKFGLHGWIWTIGLSIHLLFYGVFYHHSSALIYHWTTRRLKWPAGQDSNLLSLVITT